MKKTRKIKEKKAKAAAFFRGVVAAFAIVAAFAGDASAQENSAIPSALETERSGKATLGVDATELDFYNDYNGAAPVETGEIAQPVTKTEAGKASRSAETGNAGQISRSEGAVNVGQISRSAEAGNAGQVSRSSEAGNAGQVSRSSETGNAGQVSRPVAENETVKVERSATNAKGASEEIEFDGGDEKTNFWAQGPSGWFGREGVATSLKTLLTFSILAVAPAILLATTSFVRISVVLSLLRQGIGAGQVPSNQTIAALAVFLSLLIMAPVWSEVYETAVAPYSEGQISNAEAFQRGQAPIRAFLWRQIEKTGNVETIGVFTQFIPGKENPEFYEDVPWRALAPAFLLSELKTAFLIGFQVLIPFLIIDVVVSSVLVSTGMMMLPPTVVSLPFKLALFVLSDGWTLVVKSLLESFAWSGAAG